MRVLLIMLFVSLVISLPAQNRKIDSLENQLKGKLADSTRVMSMMRLAIEYEVVDTAKAAKLYADAIAIAKPANLHYELGRIYHNRTILLNTVGRYAEAKLSIDSALEHLQKSNHPEAKLKYASATDELGSTYKYLGENAKAIEYRLKAADLLERLNNLPLLINVYLNISNIYKEMNDYAKQQEYIRKALVHAKVLNTPEALFKGYTYMAYSLNMQARFPDSEKYIDSASVYYSPNYAAAVLASYHLVGGLTYMNVSKLDKAKQLFTEGYEVAKKFNSTFTMIQYRAQLSRVLALQKKFKESEAMLVAAYEDVFKYKESSQLNIIYEYFVRLYEEKGDYKKAYEWYSKFVGFTDSLVSERNKNLIGSLEVQLETKRKEDQITQLQADKKIQQLSISRKNIINYILIGGAVVLLVVSLLSYRNYSQKQKLQQQRITELETEKQLAATEAVLKGEEQERTRLAKDLHDGLGGMLSGVKYSLNTMKGNLIMTPDNAQAFERSMDMLDSSIREIRRVAHNMMPEALVKFGLDTALRDFCNDIDKSGALKVKYQSLELENAMIDQTVSITIYRIVQELLNNTIKHAGPTTALVQVSKTGNLLAVTVEDDGKGFDTAILNRTQGIGWVNIQNRVEFLKGKLDVSSIPAQGTSVHIELNT